MQLATLCYVKDIERNKTLMLHRIKKERDIHAGKWNGLGGKFEPTETPEQCVIREVFEESGLTIRQPTLCGFITFPRFKGDEDWYVFVYTATEFSGTIHETDEGVLEWIDDDGLLTLNLWAGDPIFMRWIAEKRFFSARFVYIDGQFIEHEVSFYCH